MENKIKFSIITINYNNLEGLIKTVNSVILQSFKNYEYIVIDGASTDGSEAYINQMKHYFDYHVSEPDTGIYNAMNKGIARANGDYCYFLNSGDSFVDQDVLLKIFTETRTQDFLYGSVQLGDNIISYPEPIDYRFFISATLIHQAVFIKRDLFAQFGHYDETLEYVSDWKFFAAVSLDQNIYFYPVNVAIAKYDTSGLTSSLEHIIAMGIEADTVKLEMYKDFYDPLIDNIPKFDKIPLAYLWKALSKCVEHDRLKNLYEVTDANKKLFYGELVHNAIEQCEIKLDKTSYLVDQLKNSNSYKIGGFLLRPFSKFKMAK